MSALILVAAGSGQRLGADRPKALVEVAGDSLIGHCLAAAAHVTRIDEIVVVVPAAELDALRDALDGRAAVVAGGATRDASVRAGLQALRSAPEHVLIHDAARPFTPVAVYERVLDALVAGAPAVIPVLPVSDTIKRVRAGVVVDTPVRDELVAVQTPQGFATAQLTQAHQGDTDGITDDAMLMERAGVAVSVVAGAPEAFKITTPFDLAVAAAMQEQR